MQTSSAPPGVEHPHSTKGRTTMTMTTDTGDELEVLRQRAEDGQRAVGALQAAEHARQARRTHELSEQQASYDRDLCQRGPQVDAELDAQRAEDLGDLSAAVERNDLGDALAAWRRECSARLAQRAYRAAWRGAYDRCAEGAPPPAESSRDPERDESLAFLPAVAQAAAVSAPDITSSKALISASSSCFFSSRVSASQSPYFHSQ